MTLLSVASPGLADDQISGRADPAYRTEYSGEDAPPGIRLKVFLIWFSLEDPDGDEIISSKLTDGNFPSEAHGEVLRYFESLRVRIETEVEATIQAIACSSRAANASGVEVRAIFNAIDDARNGIYSKYVAVASAELAALGYVDFPERLEAMEDSFGDMGFDYRAEDLISDQEIIEARKLVCGEFGAGNQ